MHVRAQYTASATLRAAACMCVCVCVSLALYTYTWVCSFVCETIIRKNKELQSVVVIGMMSSNWLHAPQV